MSVREPKLGNCLPRLPRRDVEDRKKQKEEKVSNIGKKLLFLLHWSIVRLSMSRISSLKMVGA